MAPGAHRFDTNRLPAPDAAFSPFPEVVTRSRRFTLGLAALALLVCAGGCGGSKDPAKSTLTVGLLSAPTNLDPASDVGWRLRPLTNAYLIHQNRDGSLGPGLATSWRFLPATDGKANQSFELKLRHDVHFSDGTPMTAQSVKAYFEHWIAAKGVGTSFVAPISSIQTTGRFTVVVHLKAPDPTLPVSLSDWTVNGPMGAVISEKCVANKTASKQICGAGPYMIDQSATVPGDHYTLVPNPHYYAKPQIKFSKIVAKVITNPSSMLQAFKAGQLDVADGDPSTADAAAASGADVVRTRSGEAITFTFDLTGTKAKPLADVRVRQALNQAIDRRALASLAVGKYGTPASVITSPDGADPEYGPAYYRYDPERARALLAEAGYPNGFRVDIGVPSTGAQAWMPKVASAVAKYFAAVGVKLNIHLYPTFQAYSNAVLTKPSAMTSCCLGGRYPMSVLYTIALKPGAIFNRINGGFTDATLDRIWAEGARAADPSPYWRQMTARVTAQAQLLPLFAAQSISYVSKDVGGVVGLEYAFTVPTEWFPR
jgi:peptide/nickel transport system substrate-binding protein